MQTVHSKQNPETRFALEKYAKRIEFAVVVRYKLNIKYTLRFKPFTYLDVLKTAFIRNFRFDLIT